MKIILAVIISLVVGLGAGYGLTKKFSLSPAAPQENNQVNQNNVEDAAVSSMLANLRDKKGSEFDKVLLTQLMSHNQTAIEMASLAEERTERDEVKKWAKYVSDAQISDISQMKTWYNDWGFLKDDQENDPHTH